MFSEDFVRHAHNHFLHRIQEMFFWHRMKRCWKSAVWHWN